MKFLLCLPDPRLVTEEDCRSINAVMKRLKDKGIVEIESEPVFFRQNPAPENCRKYRIYTAPKMSEGNGLTQDEQDLILESCIDKHEQDVMQNCLYTYTENGTQLLRTFTAVHISPSEKSERYTLRVKETKEEKKRRWKTQKRELNPFGHTTAA